MTRHRKSSLQVSLVLIGVAAIAGCGRDDQRRDVYASREDCLADWAKRPEDCTRATDPSHASRGFWYGPSYGGGSTWNGTRSGRSIGSMSHSSSSSHVSRGGFGASGHSSAG